MIKQIPLILQADSDFSGKVAGHFVRRNQAQGFSFAYGALENILVYYKQAKDDDKFDESWKAIATTLHAIIRQKLDAIKEITGAARDGKYESSEELKSMLMQALTLQGEVDDLRAHLEEMANV